MRAGCRPARRGVDRRERLLDIRAGVVLNMVETLVSGLEGPFDPCKGASFP